MPNVFWRAKRKVKIAKKTPPVAGSFKSRVKAHSLSGSLTATQMAADEVRGRGIDRVTATFDKHFYGLNKKKKKPRDEGHMERRDLHEFVGAIATRLAARQAAKSAAKAAITNKTVATSIAHRVAPKVTKPALQHVPKRVGPGAKKALRRFAHRSHARFRLRRRNIAKEMRLRPLTGMTKQAIRTTAADTAMRSAVDVGGHVAGAVGKEAVDKRMKTPKQYTARQQAKNRQTARNEQERHMRLAASYHDVVQNLFEKKKTYIDSKKYGKYHDTHNAIVALHRQNSGGGKAMAIPANNPSGPSKTNTRSRQNSDIDAVIQNLTEIPYALAAMNPVVKATARGPVPAASKASKKIISKVSGKKFENIHEIAPLVAVAGGTLLGGVATEVALHAGKKGYKKAKAAIAARKIAKKHQEEKQTQLESFMAGVKAVGATAKAMGSVASTTNTIQNQRRRDKSTMSIRPPRLKKEDQAMNREELIQEILATTAIGGAAAGAWGVRRLAKRNPINKRIYARKAARAERRAGNLEFKAKLTRGLDKQIGKGKSRRLAGKAKRLQRKIGKAENYKQLAAKNESTVSEGYLNWLAKGREKKAAKLRMKAAKHRATSAEFASREQRGLQKKLAKVQRKQARYESLSEARKKFKLSAKTRRRATSYAGKQFDRQMDAQNYADWLRTMGHSENKARAYDPSSRGKRTK